MWEDAQIQPDGIHIAGMHYKALIVEFDPPTKASKSLKVLEEAGRIIRWEKRNSEASLLKKISRLTPKDTSLEPAFSDIRVRHVVKDRLHYYIIFNEGEKHLESRLATSTKGRRYLLDCQNGQQNAIDADTLLQIRPHELKVIKIV